MKIAICDDDIKILNKIEDDVHMIFTDMCVDVETSTYTDGEGLSTAIQSEANKFDLLLLDIDMPGISGLEVAKKLREASNDIIIIFISSYEHFVFESLEYTPFRFIRKNRINPELKLALQAAYSLYKKRLKKYVFVKGEEGEMRIDVSEICYFEKVRRKLSIHLVDGSVHNTWRTVSDFLEEVPKGDFVRIHNGCVVNLHYVKRYTSHEITLDNGIKLLASRFGMKIFKDELAKYWSV